MPAGTAPDAQYTGGQAAEAPNPARARALRAGRGTAIALAARRGLTGPADGLLASVRKYRHRRNYEHVESRSRAKVVLGLRLKARPSPRLEVQYPAPGSI